MSHILIEDEYLISEGTYLGYKWATSHNGTGHRQGYVRIPDTCIAQIKCHGGITFDAMGVAGERWIGFDCGHNDDLPDPELPRNENELLRHLFMFLQEFFEGGNESIIRTIKTQEFVENECKNICEQLYNHYKGV